MSRTIIKALSARERRVDDLPLHVGRLRFEAACEPCGEREPGAVRDPLGGGLADHEDATRRSMGS
jgi:hypothetical protein